MSLQRNYYEVLGVPQAATTDQIKKKYRELARKYHPDVIQDKTLGQRVFSQINQAYRILADPERRAQYNSTLTQSRPAGPVQAAPQAAPPPVNPAAARPQPASAAVKPAAAPARPAAAPSASVQKMQAISGLLAGADNAIMASKPIEARAFCMKVLEIDPRSARALEVLGDALAQMGRREEAAVQYRSVLQIAPSSLVQAKLNRLEQATAPTRTVPPAQAGPANRTVPPQGDEEKPGGLLGRLWGRK